MTFTAFVRLGRTFVQMDFLLMSHHVPISGKSFATRITAMVFDSRMNNHMACNVTGSYESFVTHGTHLITHSRVDFLMRLKVTQRCKLFAANFTLEWPVG